MKSIQLLVLTVLITKTQALIPYKIYKRAIPEGCVKLDYNPETHGRIDGKFGLASLNLLSSKYRQEVYDYRDGKVVKRMYFDNLNLLFKRTAFAIMMHPKANHYINKFQDNRCYYRSNRETPNRSVDSVSVYGIFKKSKYDLLDVLGSKMDYSSDLQWKLDLLIKITKAVQHLHNMGFIHKNLKPENILMDNDLKSWVQNPILTGFDYSAFKHKKGKYLRDSFYSLSDKINSFKSLPRIDVYSLGKIFYVVLNYKLVFASEELKFLNCSDFAKNTKFSYFYCHYFEPLILSMIQTNLRKRPSVKNVLIRLRDIRSRLNTRMHSYYFYYKNLIDKGERVNSQGRKVPMSKDWIELSTKKMDYYSNFYEIFLLKTKPQILQLYPDPKDPIRVEFFNEHRDSLSILENMGYDRRVII